MQARGMGPTALTAFLTEVWLPGMASYEARMKWSAYALKHMPWLTRYVFIGAAYALVGVAWLSKGRGTLENSLVGWADALYRSRHALVRGVSLWFKTSACLVVWAEQESKQRVRGEVSQLGACSKKPHIPDEADVVVVGSGPAGAAAAYALQREGLQVLMLEEGEESTPHWAAPNTLSLLAQRFRGSASVTTLGAAPIPLLQGVGLGGSSLVNAAISWRAPEHVFGQWHAQDPALQSVLSLQRIEQLYQAVDALLPSVETSLTVGARNNQLMAEGCRVLGWEAQPTRRYTVGCEGLGRCMEGCPHARKQSMLVSVIPQARALGMQVLTGARALSVVLKQGKAVGVKVRVQGKTVTVRARKAVFVACSAVHTPLLLKASGVVHPSLGARFQAHPGVSMVGVFKDPVREPLGAMQGYDVSHFRDSHRFKLETLTLPDPLLATRFTGMGPELAQQCAQLPYLALWAVLMRTHAHGRVRGWHQTPMVHYSFTPQDEHLLMHSLKTLAKLYFAAGAHSVIPGIAGFDGRITHPGRLEALGDSLSSARVSMIISHMFGSAVMGGDPQSAVCDPQGQVHGVEGLYVVDSSLFPTSLGVNPQHTIMAMATHVAWGLVEKQA